MASAGFTIAKLAKEANVGIETIRYYQTQKLLPVPKRQGAYRHYDPESLKRLRFIKKAQAAGFKLSEIRELIRLDRTTDRRRIAKLARAKLDELTRRIQELQSASSALAELLHHCESGAPNMACPIIEAFDRQE